MNIKCYSLDNEEFNYSSVGEMIEATESEDEPRVGRVYWEADCETLTADEAVNPFTVRNLLEQMDERVYDIVGECYDSECSNLPNEAKVELQALIGAWAAKHIDLSRFFQIIGKPRECKLTAEDLA